MKNDFNIVFIQDTLHQCLVAHVAANDDATVGKLVHPWHAIPHQEDGGRATLEQGAGQPLPDKAGRACDKDALIRRSYSSYLHPDL